MNKIESAITDVKMKIKNAKQKVLIAEAEYKCLEDVLERLEIIERDKSIPHVEALQEILNVVNCEPNGTTIMGKSNIGATKFTNIDAMNMYTHIPKHTDTQNTI
jgi:hypothetical protein